MSDRAENEFFRDLCASSGIALFGADESLRIRFVNKAAEQMFGRSSDEVIGELAASIVPEDQRPFAERLLKRTIERGEVGEVEFCALMGGGQHRCLAFTLSPIQRPDGTLSGVSISARDVTRRMALEQTWGDAAKMSALGTMAGGVAHHFNNLIGGLITSIDFAQQSDDPRVLRRVLSNAFEALNRGNELTQRLLAFAEGDRLGGALAPAAETVDSFLEAVRPTLSSHHVELEAAIGDAQVRMPSRCLLTILENLSTNAVDAMPQGGTLRVSLRCVDNGSGLLLQISDTGAGITAELLPRICEPFFTTKAPRDPGELAHTGLGLAVVHGIVRGMRGTLSFEACPEGGTVCTVRLPLDPPADAST